MCLYIRIGAVCLYSVKEDALGNFFDGFGHYSSRVKKLNSLKYIFPYFLIFKHAYFTKLVVLVLSEHLFFCFLDMKCDAEQVSIVIGDVSCTDENNVNSECTFSCPYGSLNGSTTTTCTRSGNETAWSNDAPTCGKTYCIQFIRHP